MMQLPFLKKITLNHKIWNAWIMAQVLLLWQLQLHFFPLLGFNFSQTGLFIYLDGSVPTWTNGWTTVFFKYWYKENQFFQRLGMQTLFEILTAVKCSIIMCVFFFFFANYLNFLLFHYQIQRTFFKFWPTPKADGLMTNGYLFLHCQG